MEVGMPRKSKKACELCYLVVPNIFFAPEACMKLPHCLVYVQNKLEIF